jgi:hypothetical protein
VLEPIVEGLRVCDDCEFVSDGVGALLNHFIFSPELSCIALYCLDCEGENLFAAQKKGVNQKPPVVWRLLK